VLVYFDYLYRPANRWVLAASNEIAENFEWLHVKSPFGQLRAVTQEVDQLGLCFLNRNFVTGICD